MQGSANCEDVCEAWAENRRNETGEDSPLMANDLEGRPLFRWHFADVKQVHEVVAT